MDNIPPPHVTLKIAVVLPDNSVSFLCPPRLLSGSIDSVTTEVLLVVEVRWWMDAAGTSCSRRERERERALKHEVLLSLFPLCLYLHRRPQSDKLVSESGCRANNLLSPTRHQEIL